MLFPGGARLAFKHMRNYGDTKNGLRKTCNSFYENKDQLNQENDEQGAGGGSLFLYSVLIRKTENIGIVIDRKGNIKGRIRCKKTQTTPE